LQLARSLLAMSALFALTSVAVNAAPLNPQHTAPQQNPVHLTNQNLGGMNQGPSLFHPVSLPVMAPGANQHEQLPPNVSDFRKEPSNLPNAPVGPKSPEPIHLPLPAPIHTGPIHGPIEPIQTPTPIHSHGPVHAPEPIQTPTPIHSHGPIRPPEPTKTTEPTRHPEPVRTPEPKHAPANQGNQDKNNGQNDGQNDGRNSGQNNDKNHPL
jgi:hypothetical protein